MEVKFIKLITGDEIIAEYIEDNDNIKLVNPVKIGLDPESHNVRFMPYPFFGKTPIELVIKSSHIVFTTDVEDNYDNGYRKAFNHILETKSQLIV